MSIEFRAMREGEENAVAAMIQQLPKDLGRLTQFYGKLNFVIDQEDHLMFLEPDEFQNFIGEK